MNLIHNKIKIGAEKPFRFLHMSDTHFALADDRDDKRKNDLAKARSGWYSDAEKVSSEIEAFAKENHLTIAHTGDYIDFVSEANLDRLKKFTEENDVFMAAGNHEFSLYVGEAFEDADFIYAKNWAAYTGDNYGKVLSTDMQWTVSDRQMAVTDNAYFMHCLPVRRNMIVTDSVIESEKSIVIPEAANREISATVVLKRILEGL